MSILQRQAKEVIEPLIAGDWTAFSEVSVSSIAAWTTMTTMNIDKNYFSQCAIPQDERTTFFETTVPPPNWSIWIGRKTGATPFAYNYDPHYLGPGGPQVFSERNSQRTLLILGQLVLQAASAPAVHFDYAARDFAYSYGDTVGLLPLYPNLRGNNTYWGRIGILNAHQLKDLRDMPITTYTGLPGPQARR